MLKLILKGFAMGLADIVPGVSGGTVAFITGIYDTLIASISSVNIHFFKLLASFKIKEALKHINGSFLIPLFIGIGLAIVSMSKVMHYLMEHERVYTWSLFFGLILASVIYIGKQIENIKSPKNIGAILIGAFIGTTVVSLIPVSTPNSIPYVFGAGMIAICAMILPGISGSFLLLILGKYSYITGALKNPFNSDSLQAILFFGLGCLVGILSFSKLLNWLLKNHRNIMMSVLTGFMIGSLKKIWPWKDVLESKIIRGKVHVLKEANIFPSEVNSEVLFALLFAVIGFIIVFAIEKISNK